MRGGATLKAHIPYPLIGLTRFSYARKIARISSKALGRIMPGRQECVASSKQRHRWGDWRSNSIRKT